MPAPETQPIAPMPNEVPVTPPMLTGVRTEILQRIDAASHVAKADNLRLESKIDAAVQRLEGKIDAAQTELKAEIHEVHAGLHEVRADMARMMVLMEEHSARNKIVLDGLASAFSRLDHVDQRVTDVENTIRSLAAGAARLPA